MLRARFWPMTARPMTPMRGEEDEEASGMGCVVRVCGGGSNPESLEGAIFSLHLDQVDDSLLTERPIKGGGSLHHPIRAAGAADAGRGGEALRGDAAAPGDGDPPPSAAGAPAGAPDVGDVHGGVELPGAGAPAVGMGSGG